MSKEVEKKHCHYCETSYRLIYHTEETFGNPKFCPFCGEEVYGDLDDWIDIDDQEE
jgi:hypothetical protein